MRKLFYIFPVVFLLGGVLNCSFAQQQNNEQLIGFGNNKTFCKVSYEMKTIGKGEYVVQANYSWLDKKGETKCNPGICLDLFFGIEPINSLKITALSNNKLNKASRIEDKYLVKVTNDQEEIKLSARPIICKTSQSNKDTKGVSIVNLIPGDIVFKIPANILSPQYFSADHLPDIVLADEIFSDNNQNNIINAGEKTIISFDIPNMGVGIAHDVKVYVSISNELNGLQYPAVTSVGDINPGDTAHVELVVSGGMDLVSGLAEFKIEAREGNGFHAFPLYMKIETLEYFPPEVILADSEFSAGESDRIKMNYPVNLKVIVQNKGKGEAKSYKAQFKFVNDYCINLSKNPDGIFPIQDLKPGEYQLVDYLFTITRAYEQETIPVEVSIIDGYNHILDTVLSVGFDQSLRERITNIYAEKQADPVIQIMSFTSFVDKGIPESGNTYENKFALIIGNEDYAKYQRNLKSESNVIYAKNDARVFKEYANKTLGIPEGNTYLLLDATAGEMQQKINLISKRAGLIGAEAEILVYYAGHGYPDELTKVPYLIPVDVTGSDLSSAIQLSDMMSDLADSKAGKIIVFIDACFSGGSRNLGLIASRSVRIKPYEGDIPDNVLLLSASSSTQSALPYESEYHGLFTFYLLKKLQETEGDLTYGELFDYLNKEVPRQSLRVNEKDQEPDVSAGVKIFDEWRGWKVNE